MNAGEIRTSVVVRNRKEGLFNQFREFFGLEFETGDLLAPTTWSRHARVF